MKILVAPNSMKGTLNAFDFADTVEKALLSSGLKCSVRKVPVADGGDFTGKVLQQAVNAYPVILQVDGPLGNSVNATYWISGNMAIIEMAEASGMKKVDAEKLNPLVATSFGTGQLIKDAIARGCTEIWLSIGGSATVDGGMGMMEALGFQFYDEHGNKLDGNGENLERINRFQNTAFEAKISFKIICDVDNPLLGENGAAAVFGPQKGATPEMVKQLEQGLKHWNHLLYEKTGKDMAEIKRAGAAGGISLPLLAFLNAELVEGARFVLDKLNFVEDVQWADVVITGEGKIDSQTNNLKAPYVVAQIAHKYRRPVYAFAGIAETNSFGLFEKVYTLVGDSVTKEEAMKNTREILFDKVIEFSKFLQKSES